jgi:hypothetical protein
VSGWVDCYSEVALVVLSAAVALYLIIRRLRKLGARHTGDGADRDRDSPG